MSLRIVVCSRQQRGRDDAPTLQTILPCRIRGEPPSRLERRASSSPQVASRSAVRLAPLAPTRAFLVTTVPCARYRRLSSGTHLGCRSVSAHPNRRQRELSPAPRPRRPDECERAPVDFRVGAALDSDMIGVVGACDGAVCADETKTASRLWLD